MLNIFTDIEDLRWLQYILEEFLRIQDAQFKISLKPIKEETQLTGSEPCLVYTRQYHGSYPFIQRTLPRLPLDKVHWESENLYYYKSDQPLSSNSIFSFDLLWNAFLFLSRLEEYQSELDGHFINSYCFRHPRDDKSTFEVPIVNQYFLLLEAKLKQLFPELIFGSGSYSQIEVSHDLDYITKTWPLRLKQSAFYGFNTLKDIPQPKKSIQTFKAGLNFFFNSPNYWQFDYWTSTEKQHQTRSVFYIYSKTQSGGPKQWLLDPSYDISKNEKLKMQLKRMNAEGFELGLHGSFDSAIKPGLLQLEKERLENVLDININKTRQHWLRYREQQTPYFHQELFEIDATLGWNDRIGFRSGIASLYRPFDHQHQKPFKHWICPQVIMDSNIYDYAKGQEPKTINKGLEVLNWAYKIKSFHTSISWHPRTCSKDYQWQGAYELYLERYSAILKKVKYE